MCRGPLLKCGGWQVAPGLYRPARIQGHLAKGTPAVVIRTVAATFASLAALCGPLAAETEPEACADRASIVDQLKGKYQESHRASGLQTDTRLVEIWTSPASGSWTILITDVNGTSCIAAAGRAWLDLAEDATPLGQSS